MPVVSTAVRLYTYNIGLKRRVLKRKLGSESKSDFAPQPSERFQALGSDALKQLARRTVVSRARVSETRLSGSFYLRVLFSIDI
jgi:hypothetical protein